MKFISIQLLYTTKNDRFFIWLIIDCWKVIAVFFGSVNADSVNAPVWRHSNRALGASNLLNRHFSSTLSNHQSQRSQTIDHTHTNHFMTAFPSLCVQVCSESVVSAYTHSIDLFTESHNLYTVSFKSIQSTLLNNKLYKINKSLSFSYNKTSSNRYLYFVLNLWK